MKLVEIYPNIIAPNIQIFLALILGPEFFH